MSSEENDRCELPSGWAWARLEELARGQRNSIKRGPFGSSIKKAFFVREGYKVYEQKNAIYDDPSLGKYYIDEKKFEELKEFEVRPGDLIISCSGTIGKIAQLPPNSEKGIINQALLRITLDDFLVLPAFFLYLFRSEAVQRQVLKETRGSAMKNVASVNDLKSIPIALPPFNEQIRIVSKIDELMSQLEAAVESLKRVQVQLKRYRQSVLKHAVEGKLTAEWREKHKDQMEPAQGTLKRILAERRAKWEEQESAKMKASGKVPKDQTWKKKYKEPAPPNTEGLPELPEGWCWASLDQVACHEPNSITDGPFGSNLKTSHYTESGPRVIRLQNIASGQFVDEKAHISTEHFVNLSKHRVFPGDIVVATLGKPLPRACLIPEWLGEAIVKADCIRLKVHHNLAVDNYVMLALNSLPIQSWAERIVHGVGRPRLNLADIRGFPIPLPPRAEQEAIALDVENKISLTDEIQRAAETNLLRSGGLRDAILRTAFSGRLIPQNPSDQPVGVLLDLIRAEREKEVIARKKGRSSHKASRTRGTGRKNDQHEGQAELFKGQN